MDVSFSAWRHSREESLQLKGDNFSFLFDRRYTNRLNRMSRVFFEAYVVATKELAAQEDRFPSLSEIDAKMESGAVYAFKDRLMKNTEFFEEVKISGVSYLVPRALRFIDVTGTYTDLILGFEDGTVALPTRRKTPSPPDLEPAEPAQPEEPVVVTALEEDIASLPQPTVQQSPTPPEHRAEEYPQHSPEILADEEEPAAKEAQETASPVQEAIKIEAVAAPEKSIEPPKPLLPKRKTNGPSRQKIALAGAAVLLIIVAMIFVTGPMTTSAPALVEYSAYLSNTSNDSYLELGIKNPKGMANEMDMVLPQNIDQSISARGGIVTISHGDNTSVRMNSSSDASVKIYLQGNWTAVPVSLSLAAPKGFDTSLQVHGKDYFVTRKNDTMILRFNLTQEGVSFEQSFSQKR
ncbi:Uncharacterised protein [uncultured archaeon]|nr:Uncharacterised protein [uncultured archaeon]